MDFSGEEKRETFGIFVSNLFYLMCTMHKQKQKPPLCIRI